MNRSEIPGFMFRCWGSFGFYTRIKEWRTCGDSKSRYMRSEFGSVCLRIKNEVSSECYRQVRTNDYKAWSAVTGVVMRLLGKDAGKHSM